MRRLPGLVTLGVVAALGLGCEPNAAVTRIVDGRRVEGRYVPDRAYASYTEAAALEARGETDGAARAWLAAIDSDPRSAEAWTRLGALRCRAANDDPARHPVEGAWDAFARGEAADAQYPPLWIERARCHLILGRSAAAISAASTGVRLDPESAPSVIVLALALERAGQVQRARLWLDGLVARTPSIEAYEAWLGFANRTLDRARSLAATRALSRIRGRRASGLAPPSFASLDDALSRGEDVRAERLAVAMHLPTAALALRAAAAGRFELARELGGRVREAEPTSADARIALGVAADVLRDEPALVRAFTDLPATLDAPSALGRQLLGRLLARRVGPEAARYGVEQTDTVVP